MSDQDPATQTQDPPQQQDSQAEPPVNQKPDGVPDDLWGDSGLNTERLSQYRAPATDVPEAADKYQLPTIEGIDPEAAEAAPTVQLLRQAAFEAGIGQEGFNKIFTDHVNAQLEEAKTWATEQKALLGDNADARIEAVSQALDGRLPKDMADALRDVATDATVLQALEKLVSGTPAPRTDPPTPTPTRKSAEEIRALMASPAYTGKGGPRDPTVVKLVDEWYAAEYKS